MTITRVPGATPADSAGGVGRGPPAQPATAADMASATSATTSRSTTSRATRPTVSRTLPNNLVIVSAPGRTKKLPSSSFVGPPKL
jgi:hypothetical protein